MGDLSVAVELTRALHVEANDVFVWNQIRTGLLLGNSRLHRARDGSYLFLILDLPNVGKSEAKLAPRGVEWSRTSTSAPREDDTMQSFSFRSVIRWEEREDRKKPHHQDGVR